MNAGSAPAIEADNIVKSFGALPVLSGLSIKADRGDIVSLIGSSGSGKSTFLRCINLLEMPDSGTIIIGGELLKTGRDRRGRLRAQDQRQIERIRAKVGMVFQNFNLWPHMTILENIIEAPVHVLRMPKAQAVDDAHVLLKKVGLSDKAHCYPAQLSGGQQQRSAIARALAMRPSVLLFDEPTSALDPELVGEVLSVIRNLAEEGSTMIIVTHEMKFAREISSEIMFLHGGRVEEQGSPEAIFGHARSERLRQFLARAH